MNYKYNFYFVETAEWIKGIDAINLYIIECVLYNRIIVKVVVREVRSRLHARMVNTIVKQVFRNCISSILVLSTVFPNMYGANCQLRGARVDVIISNTLQCKVPTLCVHTSQCGHIATNASLELIIFYNWNRVFNILIISMLSFIHA